MPEYEDGRAAMYICRCGVLDCFAIGARIKREAGTITWSDWAWKDGFKLTDPIEELDTYTFTLSEYEEAPAGAARMLAAVPSWEPPKQKMLWPWQWGWKLPKEDDPMDARIPRIRDSVRIVFLGTDPAGLGFGGTWFPESEYDTEVDRAISWLVKGRKPEDVAARTVRYLERDWGPLCLLITTSWPYLAGLGGEPIFRPVRVTEGPRTGLQSLRGGKAI